MSVQQFCLRWNNHQPNFISVFSTLLHNESLVDVTLAAEGRHLQAHKVVLSACSSYFQTLFTVNPCQHPIVILKDVKYMDLKIMVDFMYYGEVNVSQEQLPHILKTAEMLKIKGLAEMPDSTSLTKSHSASSERADILTPGDSTWSSDTHRHSPSPAPLSPNSKRKRLRKSSTGSTSVSTERGNSEEQVLVQNATGDGNCGLIRSIKHTTSTDSENQQCLQGSHEMHDDNRLIAQKSTESESSVSVVQTLGAPMVDVTVPPISVNCSQQTPQPGLQWTVVEHAYPRFALSQCQTTMDVSSPGTSMQYATNSNYQHAQVINMNSCSVATDDNYQVSNSTSPSISSESISAYDQQAPPILDGIMNGSQVSQNSSVKTKRTKNPQADENFVRALEAVRFGGIGFCKAARMYGVNNRTLWLEFKRRGYPNNRPSIKSRVKLETPSPPPPLNNTTSAPLAPHQSQSTSSEDIYQAGGSISANSSPGVPVMCPPPSGHAMGSMMGFLDGRHVEFSPAVGRPRFQEPISINQTPINLHGVSYSNI